MLTETPQKDTLSPALSPAKQFMKLLESKRRVQILVILLVAALWCLPCLFKGLPPSTNAPTHLKYQHHFSQQFWSGEIYPRWLAEENLGYGSPVFLVQYPLPYYVTALLRPLKAFPVANRESRELGVFCFLALAAAGLAAWLWLSRFTRPLAATLGAVVYISLSFILQDGIYARGAIGELCTFIWMPLAFYFCESLHKDLVAVFPLAGVFALLLVSNLLASLLFTPVLVIYAVWSSRWTQQPFFVRALPVLAAEFLGAGIAGVYLFPLLAYRRLFDVHQMEMILPGYQLGWYFLHLTSTNLANRIIPVSMAGAALFAGVLGWYLLRAKATRRPRLVMGSLLVLSLLSMVPNLGLAVARTSGFALQTLPAGDFAASMLLSLFFTAALGFLAFCRATGDTESGRESVLFFLVTASFFFMLPFSAPIWKALPGSSVVQFPFRLGGVLTVAVIGLVALAFDSCLRQPIAYRGGGPSRLVIALATLGTVAGGFLTWRTDKAFRHPKMTEFDATRDIDPMYRAYVPLPQLFAFAKILGTAPDSYAFENAIPAAPLQPKVLQGNCDIRVNRESARQFFVAADCKSETHLRMDLLYSPLWRITPSGAASQSLSLSSTADGLTEVALRPGKQDFRLRFDLGPSARWGSLLSGVSLLLTLIGFAYFSRRPPRVLPG